MDNNYWAQQQMQKRSSISGGSGYLNYLSGSGAFGDSNYQHFQQRQHNQTVQSQLRQPQGIHQFTAQLKQRSSYYETHYPLCHADWSHLDGIEVQSILVSTYREDSTNRLQIIHGFPNYDPHSSGSSSGMGNLDEDDIVMEGVPNLQRHHGADVLGYNLYKVSELTVEYPITNLQWDPSMLVGHSQTERLATSSDCLRIYDVDTDPNSGESRIRESLTLTNSRTKNFHLLPPLTSFDWNKVDPASIITGSIDTTCTLWDLNKSTQNMAKTQLIAHDSEVFDVKFLHSSKDLFSSCGNDGSIRLFDLRSLEHSTIVYEPPQTAQISNSTAMATMASSDSQYHKSHLLLKLLASNTNMNHIAAIEANSNKILVLDLRFPGIPVKLLDHHSAPVNSIAWHPSKSWLLSGADDCQLFIYDLDDLENAKPHHKGPHSNSNGVSLNEMPQMAYTEEEEVNFVTWNTEGDWIGVVAGKGFQVISLA